MLLKNIFWIGLGQIVKIASQLIALFYLTSIISPHAYGVLALAFVVVNFASLFSDMGTGTAIVQKKNITQTFINFLFRFNVFSGVCIMFLSFIAAFVMSWYYSMPELKVVILLLSLLFPIISLGIVHKAYLEKEQKFRLVMMVEIVSNVLALALAITLAKANFGVYSLVAQSLLQTILSTILFFKLSSIKVSLSNCDIKKEDKRGLLDFSGYLFLFNFLNYFSKNLDVILIGKFFSSTILGAYSVANRIMLFPIQNITFVVTRALLPNLMGKIESFEGVRKSYFDILFYILSLSAPLMMGLMVLSKNFVDVFFGEKWPYLDEMLFWLAPTAIIQSALSISGTILTAYGRTKLFFKLGLFSSILMTIFYVVGTYWGIVSFVKFYFLANVINALVVLYCMGVLLEFKLFELVIRVIKAILPALLMTLVLTLVLPYINFKSLQHDLFAAIFLGMVIYFICFYLFNIGQVNQFVKWSLRKLKI